MLIVVSGTHASGKTTLIQDFASAHPDVEVLSDPFEMIDESDDIPDAEVFYRQLVLSARRLRAGTEGRIVVAERGPLDFLAYLDALDVLGRPTRSSELFQRGVPVAAQAMSFADVLVLLPLDPDERIDVDDDEDPALRTSMNDSLLELADDPDLVGAVTVIEIAGDRRSRLAQLEALVVGM